VTDVDKKLLQTFVQMFCQSIKVDWEAAGLMIFRLAYENCGLNPAKPDFFSWLRLS